MELLGRLLLALAILVNGQPAYSEPVSNQAIDQERILAYEAESNAIRNKLTEAYMLPPGPERERQFKTFSLQAKSLDASVVPIVESLTKAGFWKNIGGRDPVLDSIVWLVVQHSGDLELQELTLEQLEPLVTAGVFDGQMYGLLFDRVAVKRGKPQRYGTQVVCSNGRFVSEPIEDEDKVDIRRQAFGFIETREEYVETFKELSC